MEAILFREPNSVILKKENILVVDRGELHKAIPASNGSYLFSETGAGVKPLVFLGQFSDIIKYLVGQKDKKIENRIQELPKMYASACFYSPGKRFVGVSEIHSATSGLIKSVLSFVPGTVLSDFLSGSVNFMKTMMDIFKDGKKEKTLPSQRIYLKISYLPSEEGEVEVGEKEICFKDILFYLTGIKNSACV